MSRHNRTNWLHGTLLVLATNSAWAQPAAPSAAVAIAAPASSLKQAFEAAWLRQPEAQSQQARQDSAAAHRQAANSWTVEPVSLEFSFKSDRLNSNLGSREDAVGLTFPLWLAGERARTGALAAAEIQATASRVRAAQLRTAASVRESYWQWQRTLGEHGLALERLSNAQQIAVDVAKRVKAGDLARSDQNQANGAVAAAELGLAEAGSSLASAAQQLRALSGTPPGPNAVAAPDIGALTEPVPALAADFTDLDSRHPAFAELLDRAAVAHRAAELARVQTRANPELSLATTRDRGLSGESYQQNITLGIRIPFGSDSRNRAKQATAQADVIEAQAQLGLERERLLSELEAARIRLEFARTQATAADKRAQLARESRSFFQRSYQMGETDLPTRLRIELEAAEAQRQAAARGSILRRRYRPCAKPWGYCPNSGATTKPP